MTDDVYAPPEARVADVAEDAVRQSEFYVVAPRKFVLLYVLTFQYYGIYWFYRNWSQYKTRHRLGLWPVPRSIFQIFFVHALFEAIDVRLRRQGLRYVWNAGTQATAFVMLAIVTQVLNFTVSSESPLVIMGLMAFSFTITLPLLAAQRAINIAEGDAAGSSNASLTAANIAWMIAGGLFWAVVLSSLAIVIVNPDAAA